MNIKKYSLIGAGVVGLLLAGGLLAQSALPTDNALVERVKQTVLDSLKESGELERAIDQGIVRYVERQRAARAVQENNQRTKLASKLRPSDPSRDHIYGNPDALISLIEYSDFECPYCKRFHPTAEALVAAYPGQVNWVYRHFPLGFHNPAAQREAEASECVAELAGNDAFWKFTKALYEATPSNGKGVSDSEMAQLAAATGLKSEGFIECLSSGRHTARVQNDFREGTSAGVTGTPGNFLRNNRNGKAIARPGAVDIERLKNDVSALLGNG